MLLRSEGRLLAGAEDLRRWRMRLPDTNPLTLYGEDFYALDALEGLTYRLDESTQTLAMQVPPGLFDATRLAGKEAKFSAPTPASLGGFLNYDVTANHTQGQTKTNGLLELGGFGRLGCSPNPHFGVRPGRQASAIRLDTTWTRDQPMQLASLRFGDAISGTSSWGGAVRFGGAQWATNFSVQPGFVTFPLPGISGEAALPSTVDLLCRQCLAHAAPSTQRAVQHRGSAGTKWPRGRAFGNTRHLGGASRSSPSPSIPTHSC